MNRVGMIIDMNQSVDHGVGSADAPGFPPVQPWFQDNRSFGQVSQGLRAIGMDPAEIDGIMGGNGRRFYAEGFGPAAAAHGAGWRAAE